jgi:DNA-binding response OmpR family regulator
MNQILIIEDDSDIAESLQYNFRREGFTAVIAESGEKGLRLALNENGPPLLIILDLILPDMSGLEICRRLRRDSLTERTPIIMLTAKSSEADKIAGFDSGA